MLLPLSVNRLPITGMSEMNGIAERWMSLSLESSPPITAVRWSWTITVVDAERMVVVGPSGLVFWLVVPLTTFETSSYTSSRT